jgi:hypothetical protein
LIDELDVNDGASIQSPTQHANDEGVVDTLTGSL